MKKNTKILVVGTTSDYIQWLQRVGDGRLLFLTDPAIRHRAKEPAPAAKDEILCDLTSVAAIRAALKDHLYRWHITLSGIACFDCESLGLAAFLAEELDLSFPSVESIRVCRDKYTMSSRWQKRSIPTPRFRLARSPYDAADFSERLGRPCVLKPVSGSGSELVFRCDTANSCQRTAQALLRGIEERADNRLYSAATDCFLIEEFVDGGEYSCDFVLENKKARIVRLTRKIRVGNTPFGTTGAYALADFENEGLDRQQLEDLFCRAAQALGLNRALCMVDFLATADGFSLLELTPRPGGDCIPYLLLQAADFDILLAALNFAEKLPLEIPALGLEKCIGLRLHAEKAGTITRIADDRLQGDSRIRQVRLLREVGHVVTMPPTDYDSWYLGHVLFVPDRKGEDLEKQCQEVRQLLDLELETENEP